MPQDYKRCSDHQTNPFCAGVEGPDSKPYITNVNQTWAWSAKIQKDEDGFYFTALIIEWFDR